jgi:CP family cyanate transporter-like MFS transporter
VADDPAGGGRDRSGAGLTTADPRRAQAPASASRATLVAIVLLALNLRTVIASVPPLVSAIRVDLGISATVAGLLTTLPVLCFGLLAPVTPRLVRRVSVERVLVGCAATTALAAGLRGTGSTAALFAGSLLAGAAVAIAQGALPVLIRAAFPADTGRLTGAYSMALPLGATLGGGLAVPLADLLGGSWTGSLATWALPAAAATAVWAPLARHGGTIVAEPSRAPLRGQSLAWSVAALFGVQSMAFYATLAWLPEILQDDGWSAATAGGLQALANLVSILPAFAVPVLAARLRTQASPLVAVVLLAVAGLLGLLAAPSAAPLWVVLLGLGQGGVLGLGLVLPALRAGDPGAVASLTAMMLCLGYLMAATGPGLLGLARDLSGAWTVPLVLLVLVTALELLPGIPATRARVLGRSA